MKRIMILIGIVGMMISAVSIFSSAFASQIMGTPLYTDPGAHERIMSSPRPEGFRYSWPSPPSIDLEVEWKVIGDPDFHRSIRGIFIDRDGTIRVVDICRKAMRGMRVWLSRNSGRNWKIEKSIRDAWTDRSALLGKEKGKVLFSPFHSGTRPFRIWPLEVEEIIKTEFRGLYEQRAHMGSGARAFLAQDSNDPKVMAFMTTIAPGIGDRIIRIFVTVDRGKEWVEINPPSFEKSAMGGDIMIGGLAIEKRENVLRVFFGQRGAGSRMVLMTTLDLPELQEILAEK